jgi:hypothetical protein
LARRLGIIVRFLSFDGEVSGLLHVVSACGDGVEVVPFALPLPSSFSRVGMQEVKHTATLDMHDIASTLNIPDSTGF